MDVEARCADCKLFLPDTVGDGFGVGRCQAFEDYKNESPGLDKLERAFRCLGNQLFWGGSGGYPRACSKFLLKGD